MAKDSAASTAEGVKERLAALWQRYDSTLRLWADFDDREAE